MLNSRRPEMMGRSRSSFLLDGIGSPTSSPERSIVRGAQDRPEVVLRAECVAGGVASSRRGQTPSPPFSPVRSS